MTVAMALIATGICGRTGLLQCAQRRQLLGGTGKKNRMPIVVIERVPTMLRFHHDTETAFFDHLSIGRTVEVTPLHFYTQKIFSSLPIKPTRRNQQGTSVAKICANNLEETAMCGPVDVKQREKANNSINRHLKWLQVQKIPDLVSRAGNVLAR